MAENNKRVYEEDKNTYKTAEPVGRKTYPPCPPPPCPPKPKPICADECGKIIIEKGPVNIYINCCADDFILNEE